MIIPSNMHAGIAVDTFSVADDDINDYHTFNITEGTVDNYFEISGKYLILAKQLLPGSYSLLMDVVATDKEGLIAIRHFVISVTDTPICTGINRDPCHKNAVCYKRHPDLEACVCELGYSGDGYSCVDIDYCQSSPCNVNNTIGDCMDGQGGIDNFICNCKPGYDPPDCSTETDECAANPCDPVGSSGCVDLFSNYNCICQNGYAGKQCDVIIKNCEDHLCLNNGTCIDQEEGNFTCLCMAPYWGERCENSDTVCNENHPCPHGGECDIHANTCHCTTPYTDNCQHCIEGCYRDKLTGQCEDYDECSNDPHPCGNNSTLTCVNSKPCSYCCLDENGLTKFCGPNEIIDDRSENLESKASDDTPVTAIVVPIVLVGLAIVISVLFGIAYFRYKNASKKYEMKGKSNEMSDINSFSFNNPTYTSASLSESDKGGISSPENGSSVTTTMFSNEYEEPGF